MEQRDSEVSSNGLAALAALTTGWSNYRSLAVIVDLDRKVCFGSMSIRVLMQRCQIGHE